MNTDSHHSEPLASIVVASPPIPLWRMAGTDANGTSQEIEITSTKRSRVTLACQRCKSRKQKCDGNQPCGKCKPHNVECEYIIPQRPMPFGKNQYIKSLERRVAELESILSTQGMAELSSDHWKAPSSNLHNDNASSTEKRSASSPTLEPEMEDPDEAILDWRDGVDSVASVLRSLSLDVNGSGYMGASSHVTLGRLFNFLNRRRPSREGLLPRYRSRIQSIIPPPTLGPDAQDEPISLAMVPDKVADRLLHGYYKHIATRWPVVHTVWIREVHDRRRTLTDAFEIAMLHLVYATSGCFINTTGETGEFNAQRHYASAIRALDSILDFNDIRSVQGLMLMAVYCLRDPVGLGAWSYSRTALLIAIDHGMHRQTKALQQPTLKNELHKRIFWSCYGFDRQISVPMGRPFGISDRDIDIDLPLDVNEDITEEDMGNVASIMGTRTKSTSLSSFVIILQLRKIESDIQQEIYRVDKSIEIQDTVIDGFLARLEDWKATIPEDTIRVRDVGDVPFDGYDFYVSFPTEDTTLVYSLTTSIFSSSFTLSVSDFCFIHRYRRVM